MDFAPLALQRSSGDWVRFNLTGESREVVLEPEDRMVDLGSEVESGRVLAVERYQVSAKDLVVADKHR